MDVCVLSREEAGAFEHYGIKPVCAHHTHIKFPEALQGIQLDRLREVGGRKKDEPLTAVMLQDSNEYVWRGRMSGGYKTRQMVHPFRRS